MVASSTAPAAAQQQHLQHEVVGMQGHPAAAAAAAGLNECSALTHTCTLVLGLSQLL